MAQCAGGRRLCITKKEYMGMVPPLCEPTDVVCVILGAETSSITRRDDNDGAFSELVRELHVHSITDGETMGKSGRWRSRPLYDSALFMLEFLSFYANSSFNFLLIARFYLLFTLNLFLLLLLSLLIMFLSLRLPSWSYVLSCRPRYWTVMSRLLQFHLFWVYSWSVLDIVSQVTGWEMIAH